MKNISVVLLFCVVGMMLFPLCGEAGRVDIVYADESDEQIALEGYSPVDIEDGVLEKGNARFTSQHEGLTYKFRSRKQKERFDQDPERYLRHKEKKFENLKKQKRERANRRNRNTLSQ